jgi:hypothetical protein
MKKKNIKKKVRNQHGGIIDNILKDNICNSILTDIDEYYKIVLGSSEGDTTLIDDLLSNMVEHSINHDTSFIDETTHENFISSFSVFRVYEIIVDSLSRRNDVNSIKTTIKDIYNLDKEVDDIINIGEMFQENVIETPIETDSEEGMEEEDKGNPKEEGPNKLNPFFRVRKHVQAFKSNKKIKQSGLNGPLGSAIFIGGKYPSRTYRRSKHLKRKARKTYKKNA